MNKPFHIFVCHYTKLLDRKTHIDTQLAKLDNIKVHFINEYDAEMINEDVDKKYFLYDNLEWNKRWGYYIHGHGENCGRTLKISEKSLALKHYISLTKILDYNLDYALIIEDDAVFCDDFLYKLDNILNNIPEDWDLYFPNSIKNMFGIKSMDINNNQKSQLVIMSFYTFFLYFLRMYLTRLKILTFQNHYCLCIFLSNYHIHNKILYMSTIFLFLHLKFFLLYLFLSVFL